MENQTSFRKYAMTVVQRSIRSWGGADSVFTLINLLAFLLLAAIAFGIADHALAAVFEESTGKAIERVIKYVAGGWFAVLLFAITPYRMWVEKSLSVIDLEARAEPSLTMTSGYSAPYFEICSGLGNYPFRIFRIGIKNESSERTIRDVHVEIASLEHDLGVSPPITLYAKDSNARVFDIHPGAETLVDVAVMEGHPSGETEPIAIYAGSNERIYLWHQHYRIRIRVSGGDCAVIEKTFYLGSDDGRYLQFGRWGDWEALGVDQQTAESEISKLAVGVRG